LAAAALGPSVTPSSEARMLSTAPPTCEPTSTPLTATSRRLSAIAVTPAVAWLAACCAELAACCAASPACRAACCALLAACSAACCACWATSSGAPR
jgi:hypothetical protein